MRKKYLIYIFIGLFLLPVMVFAQNLLNYPQKIVIDSDHDRLLVSNYGDGSLVEIDPEGNQDYFDQYAGFIDGMDIVGNIVYGVGSDRRLIGYDLDLEEQVLEFSFPGDADDYLSINVNSVKDGDALVVTAANEVGIGTSDPAQKLHVNGDARVTNLTATNNLTVSFSIL